jgi:N-acetyltransferase
MVKQRLKMGDRGTIIKCAKCGMNYDETIDEDVRAHDKFHKKFVNGVSVAGLKFDTDANVKKEHTRIFPTGVEQYVVLVHANSSDAWKAKVVEVLEIVDKELGCQPTPAEDLWGSIPDPVLMNAALISAATAVRERLPASGNLPEVDKVFEFKVFLVVRGHNVIGCLLAQSIAVAKILQLGPNSDDYEALFKEEIIVTQEKRPAYLGVNKIWVHQTRRKEKLASLLLETARKKFLYGQKILRSEVAFTAPTQLGQFLAKNYMEDTHQVEDFLWLQYED